MAEVDAADLEEAIVEIDARWLRQKGKHTKELTFLISEIGGRWQEHRKLFVGRIEDKPVGYISFAPVHGTRPGWLHDLSRRLPECPPGVNSHAIDHFRSLEAPWLHFGFTPFISLDPQVEMSTASGITAKIVRLLAERGDTIYPAKSQLEYKMKWYPSAVLPEYAGLRRGRLDPLAVEPAASHQHHLKELGRVEAA